METNSIAMRHPASSNSRKRRLRFTLRTLFVIVSGSAIVIWWVNVPTQKVNWFEVEVNIGKSESALAMVRPFEKSESWRRSLVEHLAGGKQVTAVKSKTEVSVEPISFSDIVLGRRRFAVVQRHDVLAVDGSRHQGYSTAKGSINHWGIEPRQE